MTSAGGTNGNGWKPSDQLIDAGLSELTKGIKTLFSGIGQGVKEEGSQLKDELKDAGEKLRAPKRAAGQRFEAEVVLTPDPLVALVERIADSLEEIVRLMPAVKANAPE